MAAPNRGASCGFDFKRFRRDVRAGRGREGVRFLGQKCVDSSTPPRFQTIGRDRGWPWRKRERVKFYLDTRVRNARRERQSEGGTGYYAGKRERDRKRQKGNEVVPNGTTGTVFAQRDP